MIYKTLDDFKLAKLFFRLAAADAIGGIVMWGAKTELPLWGRSLLIFVMIGSIGGSMRVNDVPRLTTVTPKN